MESIIHTQVNEVISDDEKSAKKDNRKSIHYSVNKDENKRDLNRCYRSIIFTFRFDPFSCKVQRSRIRRKTWEKRIWKKQISIFSHSKTKTWRSFGNDFSGIHNCFSSLSSTTDTFRHTWTSHKRILPKLSPISFPWIWLSCVHLNFSLH